MTAAEGAASAGAGPPGEVRRLVVVGAGLVGGSLCLAARELGLDHVVVTDHDPTVRARAVELGLADTVADEPATAVAAADLVVVATPMPTVPTVLEEIASFIQPDALLTDVSSLKGKLTLEVESRLRRIGVDPGRFVGGHPMAGSERSGPDAADGSLFQAATWVLTPTDATHDATLHTVSGFLRRLGARVLVLPPDRHDELVAVISHLPQLVSSVLADVAADQAEIAGDALLALAGGGFRDTTRIAASDPDLWLGILEGNRPAVLDALEAYRARLGELAGSLGQGDHDAVRALLSRASAARRRLVPKSVQAPVVDLVVALEDRPGALARATSAVGEAGVNIEDLAMRHAEAGERGALIVRVDAAASARAVAALERQGLHVHVEDVDPAAGGRP